MKLYQSMFLIVGVTMIAALVACSSSSTPPPPPPAISVTFSPAAPASLQPRAQSPLTAVVTNDSAGGGVTWTVTCGSAGACGSFSSTSTASGVATNYTAPPAVPAGNTVTVTATSVTDGTKSATAVITITAATLADGTYVFQLSGEDAAFSFYYVSGAFTVAGGAITGGEQDFVDFDSVFADAITSGTVSVTANGNLQITLDTGNVSIGQDFSGTEILQATLVSGSRALVIEFDNSATSSGTLDLQTSTAAPTGGYAFFSTGVDSVGCPLAVGGIVNVDGAGTISGAGSVFDVNDCAVPAPALSFDASTVSAPDGFGRVTFTLNPSLASGVQQTIFVGYIVDSKRIRLVETLDNLVGTTGGTALSQGANTGVFDNTFISGSTYVLGVNGFDINGGLQVAGAFTANGDGSVSGAANFNDLFVLSPQSPLVLTGGSYTVDPTGRVTFTGLTDTSTFLINLQLYLTGDGSAVAISMDNTPDVLAGLAFQQATGGFDETSLSGNYAFGFTQTLFNIDEQDGVGSVTADGVYALRAGSADINTDFLVPATDFAFLGTYTASSDGVFVDGLTGLNVADTTSTNTFTYYLVDSTRAIAIETDNTQLTLGVLELQQ